MRYAIDFNKLLKSLEKENVHLEGFHLLVWSEYTRLQSCQKMASGLVKAFGKHSILKVPLNCGIPLMFSIKTNSDVLLID